MAKYNFKFGKYWLSEFGAVSAEEPTIEIAQRDVTFITVPGKDGKDCVDNGSYDNVEFKRKIAFVGCRDIKVKEKETQLINSFAYMQGYQDFEDTDHNGMVTQAALKNFNSVAKTLRTMHTAELSFTRKPFWYLKSALKEIPLDMERLTGDGVELFNPYPAEAKPIIRFYMQFTSSTETTTGRTNFSIASTYNGEYSEITYNKSGIKFPETHPIIEYDCENRRVTVTNESGDIYSFVDATIPTPLGEGKSVIKLIRTTRVNSVSIIPRWRCL